MTPLQAFQHTIERARWFVNLQDVVTDRRDRGIRADWKENFNRFMRWGLNTPIERVDGRRSILVLRDGAGLASAGFEDSCTKDLLRAAHVYGVSALDRYVHERAVKGAVKALRGRDHSKDQEELSIPVIDVLRVNDAVCKAARAGKNIRPANEVRKALQEELHRRPFQSWREIDYAFRVIGVNDLAGRLQAAFGLADSRPIKERVNAIARRRNFIVHEGDLERHQRGGRPKLLNITPRGVRNDLDYLVQLVGHLEHIAP